LGGGREGVYMYSIHTASLGKEVLFLRAGSSSLVSLSQTLYTGEYAHFFCSI
jgi:hypothetical protein